MFNNMRLKALLRLKVDIGWAGRFVKIIRKVTDALTEALEKY